MFKKIRWFLFYRSVIRKNEKMLSTNHGIKIDWVNRMFKTYRLSQLEIDDIKTLGPSYIDKILEKDRAKIEETLLELKIHQFVGLMEVALLTDDIIGVAFRFKYFDTAKILKNTIWTLVTLLVTAISFLIGWTLFSIFIGLFTTLGIYLLSRLFIINRATN